VVYKVVEFPEAGRRGDLRGQQCGIVLKGSAMFPERLAVLVESTVSGAQNFLMLTNWLGTLRHTVRDVYIVRGVFEYCSQSP
jgi:hypothetical protein